MTVSPSPTSSRPNFLDVLGRMKWDAWESAGKRYKTVQEAEDRYIVLAKELGWDGTFASAEADSESSSTNGNKATEDGEEDIWDRGDEPQRSGTRGLGVSVSSVSRPEEDAVDLSLHGLVVDGDASQLKEWLRIPGIDINEADEYVRFVPRIPNVMTILFTGSSRDTPHCILRATEVT